MPLIAPKPLPPPQHMPVVAVDLETGDVTITQPWREYFASSDVIVRQLSQAVIGSLINANSDGAAAAAGVVVGGLYRNVNAVQIRLV